MATFMELLERFVAAHEKQADAAMLLAENGKHTAKAEEAMLRAGKAFNAELVARLE